MAALTEHNTETKYIKINILRPDSLEYQTTICIKNKNTKNKRELIT